MNKMQLIEKLNEGLEMLATSNFEVIYRKDNLKLHSAFSMAYNEEKIDEFYLFCEVERNFFLEELSEMGVKEVFYGRTSDRFMQYVNSDLGYLDLSMNSYATKTQKLRALYNHILQTYVDFDLHVEEIEDGKITKISNIYYEDEDEKEMGTSDNYYSIGENVIIKEVEDFIENEVSAVEKVWEYVDGFKASQEEIFEDFLENN